MMRPAENGGHNDNIVKGVFMKESIYVLIWISRKFDSKGVIHNNKASVMAQSLSTALEPITNISLSDECSVNYTPRNEVEGGYTGFTLFVRPSVRLSVCPSVRPSLRGSVSGW